MDLEIQQNSRKMPCETNKTFGPCTLNNYDDGDIEWLRTIEANVVTASLEVGDGEFEEVGTPHIQFSITFRRSYSYAALKKIHPRVSWRAQYCCQDNNYCRKRDSILVVDRDERKKKGARTDIAEIKEVVRSTNSMRAVTNAATSVQSVRMAELWLKYNEPPRAIDPVGIKIHWRWGKPGSHKTRYIWDNHPIEEVFTPTTYKWWEGYDAHKIVLIDELRANWCTFGDLLKLTDIYPFRVETKGGSRQLQATTFYITSCYHPKDLYCAHTFDANERIEQLLRRITTCEECMPPETPCPY